MPFRLVPARDRTIHRLVRAASPRALSKGTVLYRAGDPAQEVYLVTRGFVRLSLPAMRRGRGERTVSVALPWEMFGDDAFTRGHRRYSAVAGSACTVLPLPQDRVLRALKSAKLSLEAYLDGMERELHRLRHAAGGSQRPTAAQRLADVLLDLAQRCGERAGRGVELGVRPTHQVLADLAGAHRATVTTLLNDWIYDGVLGTGAGGALQIRRPHDLWVLAGLHPAADEPDDAPPVR